MANNFEIKLPKLGESIVSATVVKIYKKEGDFLAKDESLMEVATDKVNSEIPSPYEGIVKKITVKENETVQVGDVIAIVESQSSRKEKPIAKEEKIKSDDDEKSDKKSFFSPAVVRFAKENSVSFEDLESIQGTGEGKRVTKKDIESFVKAQKEQTGNANVVELSPIRKAIAANMTKALKVPHAYIVDEIDITNLMNLISEKKSSFLEKYSSKLTITSFLAKAIALATQKFPLANASYKDEKIVLKEDINLGLAVNVNDNVLVPVIQNVKNLSFVDITKNIHLLAKKAKKNDLDIEDSRNGTITLTNFGMTNIAMGFPIILYPQACIIGAGAIKKKPAAVDGKIQIRDLLQLSLGFDHRVFDGIYACNFLNEIKKYLEHDFDKTF
ncbi:MAG: Dihydrolipoyllysine-residue acetyltransferase component of pyruvate dehydrogenase complex [Candidatus Anoxychlamydiales bacterium]|nr:Dihydrolipoyllysine-residue acetyltransferase component of pyruvate dehydrogenase complex [Candidatus Anoxychlamydiales bacterium]